MTGAGCRSGVLGQAQLVVGIPSITSPGNLAFWLRLCKVDPADADAAAQLHTMERAASSGAPAAAAFFRDWNLRLMQQVSGRNAGQALFRAPHTQWQTPHDT